MRVLWVTHGPSQEYEEQIERRVLECTGFERNAAELKDELATAMQANLKLKQVVHVRIWSLCARGGEGWWWCVGKEGGVGAW